MKFFIFIFLFLPALNLYSLTLNQAINLAIKYNPQLNQSEIQVKIQKKRTTQVKATQFGEIDALSMFNKYDADRTLQPLDRHHLSDTIFSIGAQYEVPIFTGFEITENIKISKLSEKLFNISKNLTKNQIIFNVKSIFFEILSLQKQLQAMYDYKASLLRLLKDVNLMVQTGKKPEVDLYKIQYDVKSVDAVIEKLKSGINTLKVALKEVIGKPDLKIANIQDINLTKNFKPQNIGIENLASIKKVETKKKIAEENIKKSKSAYFPYVYLKANSFENYGDGDDINIWNISLNLKFDIFDFGKRKANVQEAELEKQKVEFEKTQIKLKKQKEITDAINRIKTEEANIVAYKNQVKFAKESERIEKLKYTQGVSQIYDYLYAKSRRYLAESRYFSALYKREQAIAYYDYVIEKYAK